MIRPITGSVYVDDNFKFSDGSTKRKYFIILTFDITDEDYILVAKTTSKPKSPVELACFTESLPPSYCVPKGAYFTEDTWVVYDELYSYQIDRFTNLNLRMLCKLDAPLFKVILACASCSSFLDGLDIKSVERELDLIP